MNPNQHSEPASKHAMSHTDVFYHSTFQTRPCSETKNSRRFKVVVQRVDFRLPPHEPEAAVTPSESTQRLNRLNRLNRFNRCNQNAKTAPTTPTPAMNPKIIENPTPGLFSYASKIAPLIAFVSTGSYASLSDSRATRVVLIFGYSLTTRSRQHFCVPSGNPLRVSNRSSHAGKMYRKFVNLS